MSDGEVADHFASLSGGQMDLLNDEDLDYIVEGLESNTSAMVVVWGTPGRPASVRPFAVRTDT